MTWDYEACGEFVIRSRESPAGGWIAEAKRAAQPFGETDSCVFEPFDHECWFEFGATASEAVRLIKAEVLS